MIFIFHCKLAFSWVLPMLSDCCEMLGPCLHPEGNMGIFVLVGGLHHGSVAPSVDQAALLVSESAVLLGPSGGCLPGAQLLEPVACSSRSVPPYSFHRERRSSTTSASHCLPLFLSTVFLQSFLQSPQHCPGASLPCAQCLWSVQRGVGKGRGSGRSCWLVPEICALPL